MAPSLITITTDFGTADPYVGVMKGVILGINPRATIVDMTHQIVPQDIGGAAFLLGTAYRDFPEATVHIIVVDPGVGSTRMPLLLGTGSALFVAPDNGVLSYVLRDGGASAPPDAPPFAPHRVPVPTGWQAYALTNTRYWLHPLSHTFHGRDIFAPVAAHLSLGVSPHEVGTPMAGVVTLAIPQPKQQGNALVGHVLHADGFGNLITNIPASAVGENAVIEVSGQRIDELSPSYAEGPDLLAIIGSHGYLEVSVRNGSAAELLGAKVGHEVAVISQ